MAYTQEQLDALEAAIAEGVISTEFRDKKTTYRSLGQMTALAELMRKELGLSPKNRVLKSSHGRGL